MHVVKFKKIIASLLLLLFTAVQLSVVHELSHDDSDESIECNICITAHDLQSQNFDLTDQVSFNVVENTDLNHQIFKEVVLFKRSSQSTTHTTRPPPLS